MRKLILFVILFVFTQNTFAQSAIADLKFEEAETAFNNKDFKTVLTKLDEFDKTFGSVTAKSLYLRIVSQDNILSKKHLMPWIYHLLADDFSFMDLNEVDIEAGIQVNDVILAIDGKDKSKLFDYLQTKTVDDYVELTLGRKKTNEQIKTKLKLVANKDDVDFTDFNSSFCQSRLLNNEDNFKLLASLRKNVNTYLKAMESEGLDDKFKEIYKISESLKKYPADNQAWLNEKQRIDTERLAKIEERNRKEKEQKQAILASLTENMVIVDGGTFFMGNHDGWHYNGKYEKKHEVSVSTFKINKYEVSQEQWYAVMESLPPYFEPCPNCPVAGVSWVDAGNFIKKLNELTGKQYRLPTEAEWEFAARGGTQSKNMYSYKSNKKAMYDISKSSNGKINEGTPNELGIYCLISNVPEWCSDWHDYLYYDNSPKDNPKGPENGTRKVLRGGAYSHFGIGSRDSADTNSKTDYKDDQTKNGQKNYEFFLNKYWGFRIAIDN